MKRFLRLWARTAYHCLEDLGLQPLKLLSLRGLPIYLSELATFQRLRSRHCDATQAKLQFAPLFSDRYSSAGAGRSLYFLQDLICSTRVLQRNSLRHLDIGSRIDGFVAQIASSQSIDVLDIRPLQYSPAPNLRFVQGDILSPPENLEHQYDLVSSLHALEHVGLGRYGDPIAPDGFERALANAASFVATGGSLLISLPVAEMDRNLVQFNSQRLFSNVQLQSLLERLLPGFKFCWSLVIDDARIVRESSGGPSSLLEQFRGFGLCAVELRKQ